MNLKLYSLDDLLLTAMKAEVDSKNFYAKLSNRVENFMLKERLQFLSGEEVKHLRFFESLYHESNPGKEISLPARTPVPLPQIMIDTDSTPVSKILEGAMQAEKTAHDFYLNISERFDNKPDIKKMLIYIAAMEMGHFKIVEIEKENAEKFEGFNMEWPLMHVGP